MSDYYKEISGLVKPYAVTCDVKTAIDFNTRSSHQAIEVNCWLKPDEVGPGSREPKYIRAALFGSAQSIIEAVENAGYAHSDHPSIVIDGDMSSSLDGAPKLICRGNIQLWLVKENDD